MASHLLSFAHPSEPTKSCDTSLSKSCWHTSTNHPLDQEERSQGRTSRHMQLWRPLSCRQRQYPFALSSPSKSYFCLVVVYFFCFLLTSLDAYDLLSHPGVFFIFVFHIHLFCCLCSFPKSERALNVRTDMKWRQHWRLMDVLVPISRMKEMFVRDNYKITFSQKHLDKLPLHCNTYLTS